MYTKLTPDQDLIVLELRRTLLLPTDDLLAVTREFINPAVSRAGQGASPAPAWRLRFARPGRARQYRAKPSTARYPLGYIEIYADQSESSNVDFLAKGAAAVPSRSANCSPER